MENSSKNKIRYFPGAGYLVGFAIGSVFAIIFVAVTGVEALIGVMACAVSLPVGFSLEKKFQENEPENKSQEKIFAIVSITLGIIFFALFYFLAKFK